MKVVIVTGGRDFKNRKAVWDALFVAQPDLVVHGHCPTGADRYSDSWADRNQIPCLRFPAKWNKSGKAAGPQRNRDMCRTVADAFPEPYHMILGMAFPGGAGTANCIFEMSQQGFPIVRYDEEDKAFTI